jgi:small-conductance mechanosensitive channel
MIDRHRDAARDPFLDWKVRIFFVGAALLLASIFFDRPVLALAAAGVLGAGIVLVALSRLRARRGDADPPS